MFLTYSSLPIAFERWRRRIAKRSLLLGILVLVLIVGHGVGWNRIAVFVREMDRLSGESQERWVILNMTIGSRTVPNRLSELTAKYVPDRKGHDWKPVYVNPLFGKKEGHFDFSRIAAHRKEIAFLLDTAKMSENEKVSLLRKYLDLIDSGNSEQIERELQRDYDRLLSD